MGVIVGVVVSFFGGLIQAASGTLGGRTRTAMRCRDKPPRRRARSRYTNPGLKAKALQAACMPT